MRAHIDGDTCCRFELEILIPRCIMLSLSPFPLTVHTPPLHVTAPAHHHFEDTLHDCAVSYKDLLGAEATQY